ncbi:MAG: hypothetical protein K8R34_08695 [Methanosarcinales archaeon]|nr:hypothetical protein [Methanosarcinales archaeon]
MQNRYTADIGDFGKYGLLRALCSTVDDGSKLRLGVVWYLVPDESHNDDGKFIQYLDHSTKNEHRFRWCDPELYDALADIIRKKDRNVSSIRKYSILPPGTVFYEEPLTFDGTPANSPGARRNRIAYRNGWMQDALSATQDCDIIFVDPDNGLEAGTKRHLKQGPKYVFFDELEPYCKREQSLIIYHHTSRRGTAEEQVRERLAQIDERLNSSSTFALLYHRGSSRAFLVVQSEKHKTILTEKVEQFMQGPWSQHFTVVRNR